MSIVPPHERGSREYRRVGIALFAAGFATFALVFAPQAMLPAVVSIVPGGVANAVLLVSSTTLAMAVAVIPWSFASDRIGRSAAIRVALLAAPAVGILVPLLPSYEAVLAGRAVVGVLLAAVPALGVAYIAENLAARDVVMAAGVFVSGNTFGGICGRLAAGPVSELTNWETALFATGVVAAVPAMLAAILLPASPRRGSTSRPTSAVRMLGQHVSNGSLAVVYAQGFLVMGCFSIMYNLLALRLVAPPFNVPAALVSLIFVAYLTGTLASQFSGKLASKWGARKIIWSGLGIMAVGAGMTLLPILPLVIVGLVVFTGGCFLSHPVASGLSGRIPQTGVAQSTATYQLAWIGGTAVMGWVGGLVAQSCGWSGAVLLILASVCLSAVLAVRVRTGDSGG